jgi:predicted RNase H-like nuclease (RuvC/YqgF family)
MARAKPTPQSRIGIADAQRIMTKVMHDIFDPERERSSEYIRHLSTKVSEAESALHKLRSEVEELRQVLKSDLWKLAKSGSSNG